MAITFLGKSICGICNNIISNTDEYYSFPVFIPNTKDPLYLFNDSSFHLNCVQNHLLGNIAIEFAEEFIRQTKPGNRICKVKNTPIQNPENYIFTSLLTSNKFEPLYEFNFLTLDKNNIPDWPDRNRFIIIMKNYIDAGKWANLTDFKYLEHLINMCQG